VFDVGPAVSALQTDESIPDVVGSSEVEDQPSTTSGIARFLGPCADLLWSAPNNLKS